MLSNSAPTLAVPTPLGVDLVVPAALATGVEADPWRRTARIAGRVLAACGAALAAGFAISVGVAATFLLIAVFAG